MATTNKKIIVFYAWGQTNAGDHALGIGALSFLRSIVPENELIIVSRYGAAEPLYIESKKSINEIFPEVEVLPSPYKYSRESKFQHFMQKVSGYLVTQICQKAPGLGKKLYGNRPAIKALLNSRLVLINGGNLFYWNKYRKTLSRLVAFSFPVYFAKKHGIKAGFLPQTVGTLEGEKGKKLGNVFNIADVRMFRDNQSIVNISEHYDIKDNHLLSPDLAYFLSTGQKKFDTLSRYGLEEGKFVTVTLRDESLGDYGIADFEADKKQTQEKVVEVFTEPLAKLNKDHNMKICIVVQVEGDREISHIVGDELKKQFDVECIVMECFDPIELVAFYRSANQLIAMRLHSQIFAMVEGTPTIGVWRERLGRKIPSMMQDMGMENLALELDKSSKEDLQRAANNIIDNRSTIKDSILSYLEKNREKSRNYLRQFIN